MTTKKNDTDLLDDSLFDDLDLDAVQTNSSQSTPLTSIIGEANTKTRRPTGSTQPTMRVSTTSALKSPPTPERNKAWLIFLLLFLLAGGGITLWALGYLDSFSTEPTKRLPPRPITTKRPLKIESVPVGAQVKIDGKIHQKTTPYTVYLKLNRTYNVELSKEGCKPKAKKVTLSSKTVAQLTLTLDCSETQQASLKTDSKQPDSKKPDSKQPDSKQPDSKKSDSKKPDSKKPDSKKPASKKPASKKPASKKPDSKKPATREPDTKKPESNKAPPTKRPTVAKLGTLKFQCQPTGARYTVGSKSGTCGEETTLSLPVRSHRVRVSLKGYSSYRRRVRVRSGAESALRVRLKKIVERPLGEIAIRSSSPATVYWKGRKLGKTPLTKKIPSGRIRLTLRSSSDSKQLSFSLPPGGKVTKTVAFAAAKGTVRFFVRPWADVYINGKKIGQTPMPPKKMNAGTYRVELRLRNLKANYTLRVKGGQSTKITHTFRRP